MKWFSRRRPALDPESETALEEAGRNLADADAAYRDTLSQWPEVLERSDQAREQLRRNHFAESIEVVFRGRR